MLDRLNKLEEAQKATVESLLTEIKMLVTSKGSTLNKDHLMDLLLRLKMVAVENKHAKAGYFSAVLEAMRDKFSLSSDEQFKRYVVVLLGDKDHEKVLEAMGKVDKAMKSSSRFDSRGRGRGNRRGVYNRFANVQCYNCQAFGHYKSHCPVAAGQSSRDGPPPAKKGKLA